MVMVTLRFGCFFKALTRHGVEVEAARIARCDSDHEAPLNAACLSGRAFVKGAAFQPRDAGVKI
jgi:hypothetical protein